MYGINKIVYLWLVSFVERDTDGHMTFIINDGTYYMVYVRPCAHVSVSILHWIRSVVEVVQDQERRWEVYSFGFMSLLLVSEFKYVDNSHSL